MQPSRKSRRAFAAPLVMTIAAIPACIVSNSKPNPQAPPNGRDPVVDNRDGTGQTDPTQATPDYDRRWTVMQDSGGVCSAYAEADCPPDATCNPPPPAQVECPPGIAQSKPINIWASAGSVECFVEAEPSSCPENAKCNPPMPARTACPEW